MLIGLFKPAGGPAGCLCSAGQTMETPPKHPGEESSACGLREAGVWAAELPGLRGSPASAPALSPDAASQSSVLAQS